jgi:CRP/FNR family transcriptional regulator, cyclic AMP receptor protein
LNAPPDVALNFKPMSESKSQSRENLEKDVAAHRFLIGLTETHVRLLADCAMHSHFRAGEVIFREGETANRFYLIESGKVVLESDEQIGGAPVVVDTIGPGDLLGWSWIFSPHTWHFTARAVEPATAIFFYGTILREYCEKDPVLGYELFKRMSEVMMRRLQRARGQLIEAMKKTARKK